MPAALKFHRFNLDFSQSFNLITPVFRVVVVKQRHSIRMLTTQKNNKLMLVDKRTPALRMNADNKRSKRNKESRKKQEKRQKEKEDNFWKQWQGRGVQKKRQGKEKK